MGIESGGTLGWILRRGERFINPEQLSEQQLNDIFKNQGGHGDPVLIDPPPQTFDELMEADEGTARLLLVASVLPQQFASPGDMSYWRPWSSCSYRKIV